jgi:signal transduction histidine kinase
VVGRLEIAGRQLGDREPAVGEHIDAAMRAAGRGTAISERLLAFARRQTMAPVVAAINDVVREAAALLTPSISRRIVIDLDLAEQPPAPLVLVDVAQFEAALLNLALNACDAMPDGGQLTIGTRETVIADGDASPELPPGQYIVLSVADTGIGMDEATLRRAVEPLFTTKAVGAGTGLGLSAVLGFAQQSGGSIRIDSRPGEGTTVSVYLPAAAQAVVMQSREQSAR